ncbi:unnamed protein product [marine sediment metagenome]|uniref:Uncharacterized protein n=1 Tax=marine sediment metagenome TaxID=412755 RepID=X1M287_9ZZZZ
MDRGTNTGASIMIAAAASINTPIIMYKMITMRRNICGLAVTL